MAHQSRGGEERAGDSRWRWMGRAASLQLQNASARAIRARVTLRGYAIAPRELQLATNGTIVARLLLGTKAAAFDCGVLTLPPGETILELQTSEPAVVGGPGDTRELSVAVESIELVALP